MYAKTGRNCQPFRTLIVGAKARPHSNPMGSKKAKVSGVEVAEGQGWADSASMGGSMGGSMDSASEEEGGEAEEEEEEEEETDAVNEEEDNDDDDVAVADPFP
jgi:hypothetical protein